MLQLPIHRRSRIYLSLRSRPQSSRHSFHIMTRRPTSQRARHLLKRACSQRVLRSLHSLLQRPDFERPGGSVCSDIELAYCGESGVGGLHGQSPGIEGLCTLPGSSGRTMGSGRAEWLPFGGIGGHCGSCRLLSWCRTLSSDKKVAAGLACHSSRLAAPHHGTVFTGLDSSS